MNEMNNEDDSNAVRPIQSGPGPCPLSRNRFRRQEVSGYQRIQFKHKRNVKKYFITI